MIPALDIDTVRANAMLDDLRDALIGAGQMGDAQKVLKDEFRLLLKQIITLTPPHGLGGAAQAQGEGRVKKDLSKIFTPVDEELLNVIGSQFGVDGIDTWITSADGQKKHLIWDKIDATGAGIESFHRSNRDARGRTKSLKRQGPFWYSPYVVSKLDFLPYLQRMVEHVGRRKAAWADAYIQVGGKVQRWIARHLPSPNGAFDNRLRQKDNPSLTAVNFSRGIRDDQRIVDDAKRARRESMAKRLGLVVSGYSKDVAQKIRPRSKVRETFSDSFAE